MKEWPPSLPTDERFVAAFRPVIDHAKASLKERNLSDDERRVVNAIRKNMTAGLVVSDSNRLVASLDIVTSIRCQMLKVLEASEFDDIFNVPTPIAHTAFNGANKKNADILARTLVGDFMDQYEFARESGVSKKELRNISPQRYDTQLREVYEMIRGRALPVVEKY